VTHRGTGLLVPPEDPRALADALREVLDDPSTAAARAGRARRRVIAEFDVARNVMALEALFRETLERRKGRAGPEPGAPAQTSRQRQNQG